MTTNPKISAAGVKALFRRLQEDESFRKESAPLIRRDLEKFVHAHFALTAAQKQEIQRKLLPELAKTTADAIFLILDKKGKFDFKITRQRRNPKTNNMRIEFYHTDEGEWGVRITWEK